MAYQVEQGFKVDKGCKPQAFYAVIITIKIEFGIIVTEANVTNHLKTICKQWTIINERVKWNGVGL